MLTAFAFIVLCVIVLLIVLAIVKLGQWPKNAAESRQHPYADAINVLSWGGLILTGGLGWLAALVWAYAPPGGSRSVAGQGS
jgi:hypothetical protein